MPAYLSVVREFNSKELLATAGDISFYLVFQKLLLYPEVKRSTHKGSKLCIVTVAVKLCD